MNANETTKLESRLWSAERSLDTLRGMFAAFASVATGGILIAALATPFTTSTDPEKPSTASLGQTTFTLMDQSGRDDFELHESIVMYETLCACGAIIVAIVALLIIALRGVTSWGIIAVRVIGVVLMVTTIATYAALTALLGGTDEKFAQGPAIWLLLLGTVLYSILVFAKRAPEIWCADHRL